MNNINIKKYYTSEQYLHKHYDKKARKFAFQAESIFEHGIWKNYLREKLKEVIGFNNMQTCYLNPQYIESVQMDGYRRDKVIIQTEPEIWMPMYILIPDGLKEDEKRPCIIAPHGHGGAGKESVAGVREVPGIIERIEKYNYDYGLKFAREGYIVFCSDARGAGERREKMDQGEDNNTIYNSSCIHLNNAAISIGQSLIGMMTWDLMRAIDFLETLSYCDSKKIACCGFSGGGLQALWLSALDKRIKCSVVSGYFHGFKDSILTTHLCSCNFVPNLWENIDIGDLGAMIAPSPLLVENGMNDNLNGPRGIIDVNEQVNITKQAYELYNKEEAFYQHIFNGGHIWNGEKTYEFVNKFMH